MLSETPNIEHLPSMISKCIKDQKNVSPQNPQTCEKEQEELQEASAIPEGKVGGESWPLEKEELFTIR